MLEAVNRLGPRAVALLRAPVALPTPKCATRAAASGAAAAAEPATQEEAGPLGRLPREEFVNQKLGSKVGQQLKDVLSICGGSMPHWVAQLIGCCKFLLPFEMRRRCVGPGRVRRGGRGGEGEGGRTRLCSSLAAAICRCRSRCEGRPCGKSQ